MVSQQLDPASLCLCWSLCLLLAAKEDLGRCWKHLPGRKPRGLLDSLSQVGMGQKHKSMSRSVQQPWV